jgi:hypothetical protein
MVGRVGPRGFSLAHPPMRNKGRRYLSILYIGVPPGLLPTGQMFARCDVRVVSDIANARTYDCDTSSGIGDRWVEGCEGATAWIRSNETSIWRLR